jgi:TonB-dependent Receptor Plug Domain
VRALPLRNSKTSPSTWATKRELDVKLQVASTQETVTVDAGGATINITDATVSTLIDRQFVNDIPMNGRSFQTLVLLAPGVVTSSPQGNALGEFSVNGMRTNSNNYMVDGVNANNPASFNSAAGSAGMAPSETALGTTHSMLNVNALEEFRIATSMYSAEYGRQPGAQISFRSRSGTNIYQFTSASQILANKPKAVTATNYLRSDPTTKNLGLFVQDE